MRDSLYSYSTNSSESKEINYDSLKPETISFFPSFLINNTHLLSIKEKIKNVSWEKEGKILLSKVSFNKSDIKLYKLLLLKHCIPSNLRGEFWYIISGAKKENLDNPNYYFSLVNSFNDYIKKFNESQIEKDINRTIIDDSINSNIIKQKLKNILLSYSKRNHSIGYIQGFNFIVAKILKMLPDEEKAFWLFVQIIENILPIDFYSEMCGMMSDIDILILLIKEKYIPNLINKLIENDLISDLKDLLLKWFDSLFCINMNSDCQNAIWDILFCEGSIVLFKTAISFLKKITDKLILFDNSFDFRNFINEYFNNYKDEYLITFNLILKKFEFDEEFINYNRQIIFSHMKSNFENNNDKEKELYIEKINKNEELCDTSLPICIYNTDSKFKIIENLILTTNENLNIIEDYCEKDYLINYNDSFKFEASEIDCDELLIERKIHFCENNRKNLAKSIVINKNVNKDSNDNSFLSTGTEKSNEKENYILEYHTMRKKKYKEQRKYKYYSYEIESNKDEDSCNNYKQFETQNFNDYDKFVQSINLRYKNVSMVNIYTLQVHKKDNSLINNVNLEYTG